MELPLLRETLGFGANANFLFALMSLLRSEGCSESRHHNTSEATIIKKNKYELSKKL
jgi:hypothetical protein